MKKLFFILLLAACPAIYSQVLPADLDNALKRIEQAFKAGQPDQISDLIQSGMPVRLEDSLYTSSANMQISDLLRNYFQQRRVVSFHFNTPGNGKLIVEKEGKTDTLNVDIWMRRGMGGPVLQALNISNYPLATVFYHTR